MQKCKRERLLKVEKYMEEFDFKSKLKASKENRKKYLRSSKVPPSTNGKSKPGSVYGEFAEHIKKQHAEKYSVITLKRYVSDINCGKHTADLKKLTSPKSKNLNDEKMLFILYAHALYNVGVTDIQTTRAIFTDFIEASTMDELVDIFIRYTKGGKKRKLIGEALYQKMMNTFQPTSKRVMSSLARLKAL